MAQKNKYKQLKNMTGKKNFIDLTLTPENAKVKGYKYIDDIIFNIKKPNTLLKEIAELVNQHEYKLGTPSQRDDTNPFIGVYMPINENTI